jgi:hypothetical protein
MTETPVRLEHAALNHGEWEMVTRSIEGPIRRRTHAELRSRSLSVGTMAWNTDRHVERIGTINQGLGNSRKYRWRKLCPRCVARRPMNRSERHGDAIEGWNAGRRGRDVQGVAERRSGRVAHAISIKVGCESTGGPRAAWPDEARNRAPSNRSGTYPTCNFHKYLIGRDGKLISELSPRTRPEDPALVTAIEQALKQ